MMNLQQEVVKGNEAVVDENWVKAIDIFRRILSESEENSDSKVNAHLALSTIFTQQSQWKAVIEECNHVLVHSPANALAHFRKGRALWKEGQHEAAVHSLRKAESNLDALNASYRYLENDVSGLLAQCRPSTLTIDEAPPSSTSNSLKIRYDWAQSAHIVFVTFYAKNRSSDDTQVIIRENDLRVSFFRSADFGETPAAAFHICPLYGQICPSTSAVHYSNMKVEVHLRKKVAELHWTSLVIDSKKPLKPTAVKDWSLVDKVCEDEVNEEVGGDAALQKLFKDIYAKSDEDTRRAMIKSFQTSGGTVLSTNWKDVESADYDSTVHAPEGQEVRRWTDN